MRCKILVADDSQLMIEFIRFVFEKNSVNTELFFVSNGQEAYEMAFKEIPDIIIMDYNMPVLNGADAVRKIKSTEAIKHIPVIMFTSADKVDEAYDCGIIDFIRKPFSEKELLLRVRNVLTIVNDIRGLNEQKENIKHQNEIISLKNHDLALQSMAIAEKNKSLIDEMTYAGYIQKAMLPNDDLLNTLLPYHFLFFKPKTFVSGDFYWLKEDQGKVFFCSW